MSTKHCPDCGKSFARDATWCASCAAKRNMFYERTCRICGTQITDQAMYCKSCASKIREAEKYQPIYKKCENCGKQFRVKPSRVKTIRFCSRKCQKLYYMIPCDYCGKRFTPDHPNRSETHTCSRKCSKALQRSRRITLTCFTCGKIMKRPPSLVHNPKRSFCSHECRWIWWRGENHVGYNSIRCICEICGKKFTRTKYKVDKFGGKYCSRACFAQSQVLPTQDYYGPNWIEQRALARERDNYTCQACSIEEGDYPRNLDVHHIIPFREFGLENYQLANDLSNLISLCKHCHRSVERNTISLS